MPGSFHKIDWPWGKMLD